MRAGRRRGTLRSAQSPGSALIYVLAIIQTFEAGTVTIDGIRVTHSRGPFHRTERTGVHIELAVR